jgi:hypothetical protein
VGAVFVTKGGGEALREGVGLRQSPAGHGKDPSPDLVPRPPSPLGEGCSVLGAPPRTSIIALSVGERGDRKAVGEGSLRVSGTLTGQEYPARANPPSRGIIEEVKSCSNLLTLDSNGAE